MGMNKRELREMLQGEKVGQFVRFAINGLLSSGIHYGIYYVLLHHIPANIAYIVGYLVSFISNFFLTCYFTFRTPPTLKRFAGFCASHALNFALHVVLFHVFLWMGVHPLVIPLLVIAIAMLVQFAVLRFFFK